MKIFKEKVAFLSVVLMFVLGTTATAQKAEIGLRIMPTFSALDVQTSEGGTVKGEVTMGMGFGGVLGFSISEMFAIQLEVIYTTLSQKYTELDKERKITLKYMNIPLLLAFNTGKDRFVNFNIVAGPQIGISVGSELVTDSDNDGEVNLNDPVLSVKKGDVGVAYGAGLDFAINPARTLRLGIGYRGVRGLIDISDNNNNNSTNGYYVLDRTKIKTNAAYAGVSFLF